MSSDRNTNFIKAVMDLGQHYDGAIGFTHFKGGAIQFVGFRIMKCREFESIAQEYGKRFTYDVGGPHAVAVDDIDGPPICPKTPQQFAADLPGSPSLKYGAPGGPVREAIISIRQVGSAAIRNLLASKSVLDVWIRRGLTQLWIIPPSQITNGLFEQAQKSAPKKPNRRKWNAHSNRTALSRTCKKTKASRTRRAWARKAEAMAAAAAAHPLPKSKP